MHDNLTEEFGIQLKPKKSKRKSKRRFNNNFPKNKNKHKKMSMMSKTQGNFFKRNRKIKLRKNNMNKDKEYAWNKIPCTQTNKFVIQPLFPNLNRTQIAHQLSRRQIVPKQNEQQLNNFYQPKKLKDKCKKEKKKIENQQRLNRIKEILQITEGATDG